MKENYIHYSNQWRLSNDTNDNYSTMQMAKKSSTHNRNIKLNIMLIIKLGGSFPQWKIVMSCKACYQQWNLHRYFQYCALIFEWEIILFGIHHERGSRSRRECNRTNWVRTRSEGTWSAPSCTTAHLSSSPQRTRWIQEFVWMPTYNTNKYTYQNCLHNTYSTPQNHLGVVRMR